MPKTKIIISAEFIIQGRSSKEALLTFQDSEETEVEFDVKKTILRGSKVELLTKDKYIKECLENLNYKYEQRT